MNDFISIPAWIAFVFIICKKFAQTAPKLNGETRAVVRSTVLALIFSPSCFIVPSVGSIIPAPATLVLLSETIDRVRSPHLMSPSNSGMMEISIWSVGICWTVMALASLFAVAIFSSAEQEKQNDNDIR